jgi:hypothetical protein
MRFALTHPFSPESGEVIKDHNIVKILIIKFILFLKPMKTCDNCFTKLLYVHLSFKFYVRLTFNLPAFTLFIRMSYSHTYFL